MRAAGSRVLPRSFRTVSFQPMRMSIREIIPQNVYWETIAHPYIHMYADALVRTTGLRPRGVSVIRLAK